ncbi:tho complex subunit 1 [Holotrichia oblita]|uniref:Tho complex subunit 1 n=1 Tax=Holotrichia oblita TaxID=644536 RepID=A0ACB9SL87_HOLOL|nr:tho complex subunit 1 [Holotrichia oblita]
MTINFESLRNEYRETFNEAFQQKSIAILEAKNRSFNKTEIDLKSPLDQVFRDVLLEYLEKEADVVILQDLVLFCIETCRKGLTTPTMPVVLLGDIFESLTLELCERMFTFVEEEVNVWKEELFFVSCKNNLLRMCNDLLRRLSRSSATVFCGRILLFLAKFFPFSERSGLNIVSEFNLENITEYGTEAVEDSVTEIEVGDNKKNIVIDYSLYCKFWSLQDFFRNPNQCYNKMQWKLFCSHATSILGTFQGLKLDYIVKDSTWIDPKTKTSYFPKYLTNQKLLDLQIYDVNFRRFILLQFLILFQYLTSQVKFKSDSFELKQDQKDWVQNTTDKIYNLLAETPPDGEHFAKIFKNILRREEYWSTWKNDGCPEFKKSLSISEPILERKSNEKFNLGDAIKDASNSGKFYLGNSELTKLWNLYPDNLEACKAKDRDFLPSLETYFAEAIDQVESGVIVAEDEYLLKDPNFGWRALRLMARRSPHFFSYSNNPFAHLSEYLEMMIRKIAADRPGQSQENNNQNDAELEANLFKPSEDIKKMDNDDLDDNYLRFKVAIFTYSQFDAFSENIAPNWKSLAVKLGFKDDEIEFFDSKNEDRLSKTKNMLHLWFEDDDDSTLENFSYILEGLDMLEAAEVVKQAIQQNEIQMNMT